VWAMGKQFYWWSFNPLTPELNPSAHRCLTRFFTGILIFKGLTARRLYKSFGVKWLNYPKYLNQRLCVTSNSMLIMI
jgi:hypothetical protein